MQSFFGFFGGKAERPVFRLRCANQFVTAFENARIGKGAGIFHFARLDERTSAMNGEQNGTQTQQNAQQQEQRASQQQANQQETQA